MNQGFRGSETIKAHLVRAVLGAAALIGALAIATGLKTLLAPYPLASIRPPDPHRGRSEPSRSLPLPTVYYSTDEPYRPSDPRAFEARAQKLDNEWRLKSAPSPGDPKTAPLLWRNGLNDSVLRALVDGHPSREWIEYWIHLDYNVTPLSPLGDHEGEWEGMAVLYEDAKPKLVFLSGHEYGHWVCARELWNSKSHRIEAFAAHGTHALYPKPGRHPIHFLGLEVTADVTTARENSQAFSPSVERLRALESEPYYGFSGAWGRRSWLPGSSGPQAPGPTFKTMPKRTPPHEGERLRELDARCETVSD